MTMCVALYRPFKFHLDFGTNVWFWGLNEGSDNAATDGTGGTTNDVKIDITNKVTAENWGQTIKLTLGDIELTNENLVELRQIIKG